MKIKTTTFDGKVRCATLMRNVYLLRPESLETITVRTSGAVPLSFCASVNVAGFDVAASRSLSASGRYAVANEDQPADRIGAGPACVCAGSASTVSAAASKNSLTLMGFLSSTI